jgi:hypothetical protein
MDLPLTRDYAAGLATAVRKGVFAFLNPVFYIAPTVIDLGYLIVFFMSLSFSFEAVSD